MATEALWKNIVVSPTETFHLLGDKPLYSERYSYVMKYHDPGLAPVKNDVHAFHIDIEGRPAYSKRFLETFGFYEETASVRNEEGWFHINLNGEECYQERYLWCGNFQEGRCPVRSETGYFHIDKQGNIIYEQKYAYVGDFKDGYAVVCESSGLNTHIDRNGKYLHNRWFFDLDVYHKGFARARDARGWFHINKMGNSIYLERYLEVEPFYNGISKVRTLEGNSITIDTAGKKISSLCAQVAPWVKLSDMGRLTGD